MPWHYAGQDVSDLPLHCASSSSKSLHNGPALIRIELSHRGGNLIGWRPQIFLKQWTVLIQKEGHDAGIAVFRRIGHDCKAASHVSINDVASRTTVRVRSLFV